MEVLYIHTPGLKVVCPSTPYDAKGLLIAAIRDPDPVIFMEPKRLYRSLKEEIPDEPYTVEIGKARVMIEGNDVTVIGLGFDGSGDFKNTSSALRGKYFDRSYRPTHSLSPLDTETILASVQNRTLRRDSRSSTNVRTRCRNFCDAHGKALFSLKAPVERVTGFDVIPPLLKAEEYNIPDEKRLIAGIRKVPRRTKIYI